MSGSSVDEEVRSPDIFSDSGSTANTSNTLEESAMSVDCNEPEPTTDVPEWKGISMDDIYKGFGPFGCQQHPSISPSSTHVVLIQLPLPTRGLPKPYPFQQKDKWCQGYVRMPHSAHSLYPVAQANGSNAFRSRWEVIQEALLQNFVSVSQMEAAILSYNNKYVQRWDFAALRHFFSQVVDEEEATHFFKELFPKIVQLALQLPTLVTGAIPLLKRHTNGSISLSQIQAASLLANAFLCTFPRRNSTNPQSEYAKYPYINFNRLFSAFREGRYNSSKCVMEKLKCIFHYFRRVTSKAPEGIITIQRRYIPKEECPRWDQQECKLPLLHITSKGTIETEGAGLLQVDFANKYVGGGVLGTGCVQEEIRFVICPELMVTMLVTEALDDTEALIVTGVERYSKYKGYSSNFEWAGDFVDETPKDSSGRRKTSVVAIDALYFKHPHIQYNTSNIIRELNKAYVGFSCSEMHSDNLPAIATGNWGCGAFHGSPQLKVLLQLMAAAVAGRPMVYFTFGDMGLRDNVAAMYWHLIENNIDVGRLFQLLSQYRRSSAENHPDFYRFLYNRSKMKPITEYLKKTDQVDLKDQLPQKGPTKTIVSEKSVTLWASRAKQAEDKKQEMLEKWLEEIEDDSTECNTTNNVKQQNQSSTDNQGIIDLKEHTQSLDNTQKSHANGTHKKQTGDHKNKFSSSKETKKSFFWDDDEEEKIQKKSDKPDGLDIFDTLKWMTEKEISKTDSKSNVPETTNIVDKISLPNEKETSCSKTEKEEQNKLQELHFSPTRAELHENKVMQQTSVNTPSKNGDTKKSHSATINSQKCIDVKRSQKSSQRKISDFFGPVREKS
ncbi:poly(ADP-ribose) glycohydrolase [Orussus abietinus]|uniref:poly(ADP-ribose) glycohydrolase n=1 Tax=Orussus abietinus TaxID=222816 RepID=UPI00062537C4|nr:poly(ADP-ribose) glycohydrolase [Orussus abietinus]